MGGGRFSQGNGLLLWWGMHERVAAFLRCCQNHLDGGPTLKFRGHGCSRARFGHFADATSNAPIPSVVPAPEGSMGSKKVQGPLSVDSPAYWPAGEQPQYTTTEPICELAHADGLSLANIKSVRHQTISRSPIDSFLRCLGSEERS